jgi:hypothetical protein
MGIGLKLDGSYDALSQADQKKQRCGFKINKEANPRLCGLFSSEENSSSKFVAETKKVNKLM